MSVREAAKKCEVTRPRFGIKLNFFGMMFFLFFCSHIKREKVEEMGRKRKFDEAEVNQMHKKVTDTALDLDAMEDDASCEEDDARAVVSSGRI